MSKAAAAAPIPAEGAGADAATVAAPELLGAALRNPDTHLAWLEPTESETELLAALEKEHPGMPGLCVPIICHVRPAPPPRALPPHRHPIHSVRKMKTRKPGLSQPRNHGSIDLARARPPRFFRPRSSWDALRQLLP